MNHLTLEQCQKLKELGFPQDSYLALGAFNKGEELHVAPQYVWKGVDEEIDCACPTLEELIEWLPEAVDGVSFMLSVSHFGPNKGKWRSWYSDMTFGIGITPLEAVYNLAVAIKSN